MKEVGLQQTDLVDVMGVSLDRVKSLTSGKVKNLKREESEALIKKLHVRGDWLATGEGPMFQSDSEREMHRRLDMVKGASGKADVQGLSRDDAAKLAEILFFVEMGNATALHAALNPVAADELALLLSYRGCTMEGRAHLIQTAALLNAGLAPAAPSKARAKAKPQPTQSAAGFGMNNSGANAVQIGHAGHYSTGPGSQHSSGAGAVNIGSMGAPPVKRRGK